jgi:hypothetical protein
VGAEVRNDKERYNCISFVRLLHLMLPIIVEACVMNHRNIMDLLCGMARFRFFFENRMFLINRGPRLNDIQGGNFNPS